MGSAAGPQKAKENRLKLGNRMKPPYLKYKSDFLENMRQVKNLLIVVAMDSEEKALINGVQSNEVAYGKKRNR